MPIPDLRYTKDKEKKHEIELNLTQDHIFQKSMQILYLLCVIIPPATRIRQSKQDFYE